MTGPLLPGRATLVLERGAGLDGASFQLDREVVGAGRTEGAVLFPDDPCLAPAPRHLLLPGRLAPPAGRGGPRRHLPAAARSLGAAPPRRPLRRRRPAAPLRGLAAPAGPGTARRHPAARRASASLPDRGHRGAARGRGHRPRLRPRRRLHHHRPLGVRREPGRRPRPLAGPRRAGGRLGRRRPAQGSRVRPRHLHPGPAPRRAGAARRRLAAARARGAAGRGRRRATRSPPWPSPS